MSNTTSFTVLRLDSSVFGERGHSSQLLNELIEQLQSQRAITQLIHRRLDAAMPHFSLATLAALGANPDQRSLEQQSMVDFADQLIDELQRADCVVIAVPMYNFGIPSTLKSWMDHVARAGTTFRYTAQGAEGLVRDKPVYLVTTRGGIHRDSPSDAAIPHLQAFFGLLGLKDVRVIYAEGLNTRAKEEGLSAARLQIQASLTE